MEQILPWVVKIVGGLLGGNVLGGLLKKVSLGGLGNSIIGMLGGGLAGPLAEMLGIGGGAEAAEAASSMDMGAILNGLGIGAAGGGGLTTVLGIVKSMFGKKS